MRGKKAAKAARRPLKRFLPGSRAHVMDIPSKPETVAERVQYIVDRMVLLDWGPGCDEELAAAWDLASSGIRVYAAEAHRIVTRAVDVDPSDIRSEIIAGLREIARSALHQPKYKDHKAAVQAYATIVDVLGLKQQPKGESSPVPEIVLTDELPEELENGPASSSEAPQEGLSK